ncbi:SurA N-terminal domain-containing protein [Oryzibacter oryziterrae]|uniref:SurA N-terminal domain-containing protein n=1 Tax=Oryzibacter oryziterrae TaxID=2766474 RepID=UPI001F17D36E|nr:SurA N-terminal domain-containing protein [Oryzibacter oryziterrae]
MMIDGSKIANKIARSVFLAGVSALLALPLTGLDMHGASAGSIKIVVNDQAITAMDIQGRAKLLQIANHVGAGAATKAAQDELIDEALRMQDATARGVVIDDAQVDAAIASIASRSKMSASQFAAALGHAGVPIRTLKDRIRTQMAWGKIIRAKLQLQVRNQNSDLIAQMRDKETSASTVTAQDYVLQRIVFTVQRSASDAVAATRLREAQALRGKFTSCSTGIPMVKGMKEVAVQNVGRKLASEVPPGFQDELKATDQGHLTKPQRTDLGFEMYAVCEKVQVTGEAAVGAGMDAEAMSAQGEQISKTLTQELRQKANIAYR